MIDAKEWDDAGAGADVSANVGEVYDGFYGVDEADDPFEDSEVFQVMDDEGLERKICYCIRQYWIQVERLLLSGYPC